MTFFPGSWTEVFSEGGVGWDSLGVLFFQMSTRQMELCERVR